jgi:HEPN domain-containing protein
MRPADQIKGELVDQWVAKALEDLGVAQHLAGQNLPYFNAIGFHCQQTAEKFIKAFLVAHQVIFPKTHDLEELLRLLSTVDE